MIKTAGRIKYLDLMRFTAIFMMVQGHTTDTFLAPEYRSFDYFFYNFWASLRTYTAPIFFFTSGAVLTWLLYNEKDPEKYKRRIKKGYIRTLELILMAYLLRFPSHKIFSFSHVTSEGWKIFFTVDALHLISCGIFLILIITYISEKIDINYKISFFLMAVIIAILTDTINEINWKEIVVYPLTGYFCFNTGSYFPLFPYLVYMFLGAFTGTYIGKDKSENINFYFFVPGVFMSLLPFAGISGNIVKIIHISGILFVLMEISKLIVHFKTTNLSKICLISDKSLLIYMVHLIILYGCAWFPGFYKIAGQKFSVEITLLFVILMLILSYALVIFTDRIFKKKQIAK